VVFYGGDIWFNGEDGDLVKMMVFQEERDVAPILLFLLFFPFLVFEFFCFQEFPPLLLVADLLFLY
jgi:hypothetical protein